MAIWYVDSNIGNDGNDGLKPGTAFLTIQHAHDQTNPGDTVYIMPGKGYGGGTGSSNIFNISRSGSLSGGYITYSGYPGQPFPILSSPNGSSNPVQFGDPSFSFTAGSPLSYIIIQNLELIGQNGSLTLTGAWANASLGGAGSSSSGTYNSGGMGSTGIGANRTTLTASGTSSSNSITLTTNPITAGVKSGDVVFDTTSFGRIVQGTTVIGTTTTSVTLSQNANATQNADQIKFIHPIHHLTIQNCIIHDFSEVGIGIDYLDYCNINNNIIYNNAWYSTSGGSGLSIFQLVDVDTNVGSYKNVVSGNVLYNNRQLVASLQITQITMTANGGTSNQTLTLTTNPSTAGVQIGMQVFDGTSAARIVPGTTVTIVGSSTVTLSVAANAVVNGDSIFFSNFSDGEGIIIDDADGNQQGQAPYAGKILVVNNLCVNNGSAGIEAFDSKNVDIIFNTCYLNQQSLTMNTQGEISHNGANGVQGGRGMNNIVVAASNSLLIRDGSSGTVTYSNNLGFGGNGTALPGTANVTGDPIFVNPTINLSGLAAPPVLTNFQLSPGSPAIDAGTSSAARLTDILGNPGLFGPSYDMGCYESPCSTWGGNTIQSVATLMSTLLADNVSQAITPLRLRQAIATTMAGRSPWPR